MALAVATAPAPPGPAWEDRRRELGLSRAELARRALVDKTTVFRLERGDRVGDLTRRRIAAALEAAGEAAA
jgi:predicted transcriptional regulator